MIDELFIHDRDRGLFKEILKRSSIIEGRYHVSTDAAKDLNTGNLDSFSSDPQTGVSNPGQKYPIVVCLPPKSRFVKINGQRWEEFFYKLLFLTKSFRTADNQIKSSAPGSNASSHHIWYDWQDMKTSADDFLEVLKAQLDRVVQHGGKNYPLKSLMQFDAEAAVFQRLSRVMNDNLSGVGVDFSVMLFAGECGTREYSNLTSTPITIPQFVIHAPHKQ